MSDIKICGISGKAGTGKDFIYENILRPIGFYRWAFADHMKIWAVSQGLATYEEVFVTKPKHIRHMLQQIGTEEGRNVYGTDIWLNTAKTWINHLNKTWGIDRFCITDARFPNEVDFIKQQLGGITIRINAPKRVNSSSLNEEARKHISETALDGKDYMFDAIINNDPEYKETVYSQIISAVHKIDSKLLGE